MDEDLPSTSNQPQFFLESAPKIGLSSIKRPYANFSKSSPAKKRKFPGPAAVLHDIIGFEDDVQLLLELANEPSGAGEIPLFRDKVWKAVTKNFGIEILSTYNISWIEKKLETNSLHNVKVPFLAAIVSKIEWFQDKIYTVTLTLKDPRGEIKAVIVPELFDMFAEEIVVGAAVVLRSFRVLTMGLGKSHYVVISSNNLLAVFTKVDDKVQTCKPHLKQAQKEEEGRRRIEKFANFPQNRKECNVGVPQGLNVFETETFDFEGLDFDTIDDAVSLSQSKNSQENSVFTQEVSQGNQNTEIPVVFQEGGGGTNSGFSSIRPNNLLFGSSKVTTKVVPNPTVSCSQDNSEDSQIQQETFVGIDNNSKSQFVNSDVGGSERKSGKEEEALEAKKLVIRKRLKQFKYLAREVSPAAPTVVPKSTVSFISCSQDTSEDSQIQQETFEDIDINSKSLFVNSDVGGSERKSHKEEEALEAKKLAVRKRLKQFKYLAREVPLEVPNPAERFIQETSENSQIQQETLEGIDNNSNSLFVNSDVRDSERQSGKEEGALGAQKLAIRERLKQFRYLAREVSPAAPTVVPNPSISFISCSQDSLENSQILQEAFDGIDTNSLFDDF